ncbi:MAG: RAD55 family ATPase [Candidatus Freyarchaeota archaeon]
MSEREKDKRIPTGIQGLDELLNNGLRPGSLCIVMGEPLCGKEVLAKEFFYRGLEKGEAGIYVTTNNFAEDVSSEMEDFGWSLISYGEQEKVAYKIIDTYTQTVNPNVEDTKTVMYVPAATDLAGLSSKIVEAITSLTANFKRLRMVLDSLSSIITFTTNAAAIRFLSFLKARTRLARGLFVTLLESELTEKNVMMQILQLADVIIEIKGNKLHVRQSGKAATMGDFKITEKGIEINPTKTE